MLPHRLTAPVRWRSHAPLRLLAMALVSAVMMLGLAGLYFRFRERPAVAGAMEAVKPVVVGMLFWTAIDLFPSGVRNVWSGVVCALACLALVLKVHPALVIVIAMAGGALLLR